MSKEIDISAIKEGDKVLVEHEVYSVTKYGDLIGLDTENNRFLLSKTRIKQHTPKAFDWGEVKQGMAFVTESGAVYYYIAKQPMSVIYVIVSSDLGSRYKEDISFAHKDCLTRAPEHDVKGVGDEY